MNKTEREYRRECVERTEKLIGERKPVSEIIFKNNLEEDIEREKQRTGIQYTRLLATRNLKEALTTLRKLGESRQTLKDSVDVICNKVKKEIKHV